jgi:hypothetical protein
LFWEKSTAGWLLVAGLFWEKSTAGWWLISRTNRLLHRSGKSKLWSSSDRWSIIEHEAMIQFLQRGRGTYRLERTDRLQLKTKLCSVFLSLFLTAFHTLDFDLSDAITWIYWAFFHVCKKSDYKDEKCTRSL